MERRKPDVIINDVFEMNRRLKRDYHRGFYRFGVETVQFQYFFKEVMAQLSVELGEYIPIEEIQSIANKMLRIQSLQPYIKTDTSSLTGSIRRCLSSWKSSRWVGMMMLRMAFRWPWLWP